MIHYSDSFLNCFATLCLCFFSLGIMICSDLFKKMKEDVVQCDVLFCSVCYAAAANVGVVQVQLLLLMRFMTLDKKPSICSTSWYSSPSAQSLTNMRVLNRFSKHCREHAALWRA